MLQTSTNEIITLPTAEVTKALVSALSPEDNAFYNSLKTELNKLLTDPANDTVDNIMHYSNSFNN